MEFYTDPNFIRSYRKVRNIIKSINDVKQIDTCNELIENFKNYWISKGFPLVIMDSIYIDDLNSFLDTKVKSLNLSQHEKLIQKN